MYRWMILLFCFLMMPALSWAVQPYVPQKPDPLTEDWRYRSFPELKGKGLNSLAEAQDGAIWFGVDPGVMRYDGVRWTLFTPEDGVLGAPVRTVCGAGDGAIYVGSEQGLSRFFEGRWQHVFPQTGDVPWPVYDVMEAKDGSIWAATGWGALRLAKSDTVLYTSQDVAPAVRVIAPELTVSVVPAPVRAWPTGLGIAVVKGDETRDRGHVPWVVSGLAPGGPGEKAGLRLGDQIVAVNGEPVPGDLDGEAGSQVHLRFVRDGQTLEVDLERRGLLSGFRSFAVFDVFEDRNQHMWLGLLLGEMVVANAVITSDNLAWRIYANELAVGQEPRLAQTQNGDVWSVSNSTAHAINRFDGKVWTQVQVPHERWTAVNTSVLETEDGTLWIGGFLLAAFKDGQWRVYTSDKVPIPYHRTRLLEASDGALWIAGLGEQAVRIDLGSRRWATFKGLHFQCETSDGAAWFIARPDDYSQLYDSVVRHDPKTNAWTRYNEADGLMDMPMVLLTHQDGTLWAAGGHDSLTATAQFDGQKWTRQVHTGISWGVSHGVGLKAQNGDLWFGAALAQNTARGDRGGLLRYRPSVSQDETWTHLVPWRDNFAAYAIGQSSDGMLWFGGDRLRTFDGEHWRILAEPKGVTSYIHEIVGTDAGDLWVGTRNYGVFHRKENTWTQYSVDHGLSNNTAKSILPVDDGSVWVATGEGVNRFDGFTWTQYGAPVDEFIGWYGSLRRSDDGAIWVNTDLGEVFETVRYLPDAHAPETEITLSLDEVAESGNTVVNWQGIDPWRDTPQENLQYAWRIDNGPWSHFSSKTEQVFASLSGGQHTFEVKARDLDFNEDTTPAVARFRVVAPLWQQPIFIGLVIVSVLAIGFQSVRVFLRDRHLLATNQTLEKQIAEVRKAREEAEYANRAKSIFLANMSHEIRTPMNAILGYTQILAGADDLPERHQRSVATIGQSGEHLLALINDVLDISKIEAGREQAHVSDFDLQELVEALDGMFDIRCQQKNLTWKLETHLPNSVVMGDQGKIRQVLINLLGNAVKFTEQGTVTFRVIQEAGSERFLFEVSDTGAGIALDKQESIFEPFQQEDEGIRHGGTGLGLAIAHQYVELLGGTLTVKSEPGQGAVFSFALSLPSGNGPATLGDHVDWSRVSRLADGQVVQALVVDDVENNRDILAQVLTQIGATVEWAENGALALEKVREKMPDVVFLDMRMPVMGGDEVLAKLLDEYGEQAPKVVAVTASVFDRHRDYYLSLGFNSFVDKPLRVEQVFASLHECLGVEFVFDETTVQSEALPDWSTLELPQDLHENLMLAVDKHSVTELRQYLDVLRDLGPEFHPLASHLRNLTQQFDIEGVGAVLTQIATNNERDV